jgi:hypothetical protein
MEFDAWEEQGVQTRIGEEARDDSTGFCYTVQHKLPSPASSQSQLAERKRHEEGESIGIDFAFRTASL